MRLDPATLAELRALAAEVRALAGEDDVATADTIEGASEAMEMLDGLIDAAQHAAALEAMVRERAQRLTERARRFAEQGKGYRRAMLALMEAMTLRKVVRPGATLSLKAGGVSLEITDPAAVPTQLRKPGDPDKAAIRAHLEAGEAVPGARLVRADDTISMRTA